MVAVLTMQLTHGDQVRDQMIRQPSIPEPGFLDLWRHAEVLDGAAQNPTELLRVLGHCQ